MNHTDPYLMNDALPAQIMNLPDKVGPEGAEDSFCRGYKFGHRDARHAAAELVSAAIAAQPAPVATVAQQGAEPPGYVAHVGSSDFEGWHSSYSPAGKGDKQRARDAYAAGMTEAFSRVAAAHAQQPAQEQQERAAALLDGFDSRIETATMNGDAYDAGYLKAMRAKFCELLDAAGIPAPTTDTGEQR